MTLLSRKADYALLILSYLHNNSQGGSAYKIADQFHLSQAFAANILKELCQKGYVASHRGVKGGYTLLRPAEQASLADLIDALDEPFSLAACNHGETDDGCGMEATCAIKGPIADVHHRIREVLRTVTLADLFRPAPADANAGPQLLPPPTLRRDEVTHPVAGAVSQ